MVVLLEKVIEIGMLFDFYGKLLTDKQQEAMELYYFQDLSLAEIAERLDISRQGVYDHLHRAEEILRNYENKLALVNRYLKLKDEIDNLAAFISGLSLKSTVKKDLQEKIEEIKKDL
ncbi:YlxM family DNA-binding protein [Iocasia frigidifontis]|uniref:YlxM family DNA-binding protein n=1 Tax=Iocasia fonsfrigidae TaxID=2682810 RepID=UPI0038B2B697